jgi:ABC-type xylose transport system permease subunit
VDERDFHRLERKIDYIAGLSIGAFSVIFLFIAYYFWPSFAKTTLGGVVVFVGWLAWIAFVRRDYGKLK